MVTGIQFTGGTVNVVARNLIYGLTTATNSTAAEINGIRVAGGTTAYRNNMIAVGAGIANAIGTGSTTGGINGIFEAAGTNNFFHNSVYVGGAPTAGVGPSYAFASTQVTVVRSARDNVFFNARSNAGATGKNYVIRVAGTAPNPAGLTLNNNVRVRQRHRRGLRLLQLGRRAEPGRLESRDRPGQRQLLARSAVHRPGRGHPGPAHPSDQRDPGRGQRRRRRGDRRLRRPDPRQPDADRHRRRRRQLQRRRPRRR